MNLISLFSSGFYVVSLFCPVPFLSPSDGSTGRGLQTNLTRSGKKAFPLLFHENPVSRTFATSIPHTVLFSNNASMSRFWRIPLPRRTNPYPVKKFWVYPNPTMYFVKIPNPVNTLSGIVSFAAVIRVVRHWSWRSDQIPGGTQQIFIRGGSAPRSNPLPIYIPFFTKKILLRIPSIDKRYPFHIPLFRTLHPFQLLWMHCLLNRNQSQKLNVFSTL